MDQQVFVARERELAQLNEFLDKALAGQGQICFVTGEAGAGKTALVTEFARRAQDAHPDLVVALGNCNAQTGLGDPYLPFREVLGMLTGDVEAKLAQGAITQENAHRLRGLLNLSGAVLVEYGPDLVDLFVPGAGLLMRAGQQLASRVGWVEHLQQWLERRAAQAVVGGAGLDQSRLFAQYTAVLQALAAKQLLVLALDDLHWVDASSVELLFHLGRRIGESRILIVGTYRPEDVALGHADPSTGSGQAQQHPLEGVASELKRYHGDVWVDLDRTKQLGGRQFVEALLDAAPNRLGEAFRQALFQHTGGHALFTTELIWDLQERGDLVLDENGQWIAAPTLTWEVLPARVEGVIEKRIGRLEPELRDVLTVASVEGEDFTAQVVARVQELSERLVLRTLSRELEKRHRLVQERGEVRVESRHLSRYRFAHALFQQYVYNDLSAGERRLLHGEIAEILEALYGDQAEEIAVQLAHHFTQGEAWEKAFRYLALSGDKARQVHAGREAIAFYTRAEEASRQITPALDAAQLLPIYEGRGLVRMLLTRYDEAIADFGMTLRLARALDNQQKEGESLCHLAFVHWAKFSEDQAPFAEQYAQEALQLSQQTGDQRVLAKSLTSLGIMDQWRGNLHEADKQLEASLQISRRAGYKDSLAQNLMWLSAQANWQGNFSRAIQLGQESLAVSRAIHDGLNELFGLAFLCLAYGNAGIYGHALALLHEGMTKAKEWENKFFIGRLTNQLGWFHSEFGDFSRALEYDHESTELGRTHGISNVEISALINLGFDYFVLGQYERALSYLEPTLERVEREAFGSHRWRWKVRLLNGIAEVYHALGDHEQALRYIEAGLQEAQATSSQKYVAKDWALRGKILARLGNTEAAGADLQRAFAVAERLQSPTLIYPIAYDLGRWHAAAGREQEAAELYGKAHATIEHIASDVEDEALRSIFLQSTLVQTIKQGAK